MEAWRELRLTVITFGLVAAPVLLATLSLVWRRPRRLLPLPHLKVGYWLGRTVVWHMILSYAIIGFAYVFFDRLGLMQRLLPDDAGNLRKLNLISPLAYTLFLAASISMLYAANRTPAGRVGLGPARWRANLLVGCLAFLAMVPVVFGVYAVVLLKLPAQEHAVQQLAKESLAEWEWLLLFVQVVVLAPVAEEWLFRGLLQGWLRRATLLGHAILVWLTVGLSAMTAFRSKTDVKPNDAAASDDLLFFAIGLGLVYAVGVIVLFRPILMKGIAIFRADPAATDVQRVDPWLFDFFGAEGEESRTEPWQSFGPRWPAWKFASARWSIVGSAMVFSLMHPWPTPIPLFVLGLGLGWLAYRTQSLVPSIVVHALFNLVSFLVLVLTLHPADGNDPTVAARPAASGIVSVVPGSWWPRLR